MLLRKGGPSLKIVSVGTSMACSEPSLKLNGTSIITDSMFLCLNDNVGII